MTEKRRGLGRGLGALIPNGTTSTAPRPSDVFFAERVEGFTGNNDDTDRTAELTDPAARVATPATDGARGSSVAERSGVEKPRVPGSLEPRVDGQEQSALDSPTATVEDDDPSAESGADLQPVPGARFAEIDVSQIRPNPKQPRSVFDEDDMAELVHSITEIGVLQPIVVRPTDDVEFPFELIMGERRWRASQAAHKATVPAIIRETADDDLLRDALLENLHRAQLNPLEEAAAYRQLLDDFDCTHDVLAGRIGRSRPQISNTLRLLKLPPVVQRRVAAGVLSAGHARALLGLDDAAAMERLAQRIVAEGLSVRSVEEIVALGVSPEKVKRTAPRMGGHHPQLDDLASSLSNTLDTRVGLSLGRKKGKLTVEFASMDDLNRIMELLGLPKRT